MIEKETSEQLEAKKRRFARTAMDAAAYIMASSTNNPIKRFDRLPCAEVLIKDLRELAVRLYPNVIKENRWHGV